MFKILDEACKPTKGSKYSAGIDLYAREDITIGAGETKLVPLGVKISDDKLNDIMMNALSIEKGSNIIGMNEYEGFKSDFLLTHHLELFNRSSTAYKKGLILANGTGIIDLDFKDEICGILHNPIYTIETIVNPVTFETAEMKFGSNDERNIKIKKGDKICQIILKENKSYLIGVESEEERTGGLGSTGK